MEIVTKNMNTWNQTQNKKPLKIIATGWQTEDKPKTMLDWRDIPKEERDWSPYWYLHGELESLVGYDRAIAVNCKSNGYSKQTINWSEIVDNEVTEVFDEDPHYVMYINGIVPVEVDGLDRPCLGFFWVSEEEPIYWMGKKYTYWKQRGLVCLESDKEGCEYAKKLMEEKPLVF